MNPFTAATLHAPLRKYMQLLEHEFEKIPPARKAALWELTEYIELKRQSGEPANLVFICTHNSRRSHMAQIWAQTAAYLYGASFVTCFSGGTEATAFNPRAVKAIREAGFEIIKEGDGDNPEYTISFSEEAPDIKAFSKVYDDPANAVELFAAIMTCSHADENCPFIPGAEKRIPITYDDPKDFDGTDLEEKAYRERTREIGREMMFVFGGEARSTKGKG